MKNKFALIALLVIFGTIAFTTLSPLSYRPPVVITVNLDRMLAFAGLIAMLVIAFPRRFRYALAVSLVLPATLEILQTLSPTRHAEVTDVLIKTGGGIIGCVAGLMIVAMVRSYRRRADRAQGQKRLERFIATARTTELAVQSRMIQSIHFSPIDGTLLLRFADGRDGLFEGVSEAAAQAMATAKSPGQFYLAEFKPKFLRVA
jgi:hypothetical protein